MSSGYMPLESICVIDGRVFKFFSITSIVFSAVPGMSWIMKPPAHFTEKSVSTSTPRATEEGVCSDAAK